MKLPLTMAIGPYEHVRDLADGRVAVEGVDLNFLDLPTLEIFHRFTERLEFDVAEMSFGRYLSLAALGDSPMVALPVFVSRVFRLGSIYVRAGGDVRAPADLRGKRIGVPEWAQTATIYIRGWLQHNAGVDLASVRWTIAGVNAPNPFEQALGVALPPGLTVERVTDRSLSDMLAEGALDAVFSAGPPRGFVKGGPVVRLFPEHHAVEEAYYRETGIFPIMHVVCMRRALAEEHPWLPLNLLRAFYDAKESSLARMRVSGIAHYAIPWHNVYVESSQRVFGRDFWPYGVEANRKTLEAFTQYGHEQGVARRRLAVEELFAEGARDLDTFYSAHEPPTT